MSIQPPPPAEPPPPSGAPQSPPPDEPAEEGHTRDNGIAVAGLIVALGSLILSIIVIGGITAFAALIMSVIGLRRSRTIGQGKGAAIGGIGLSLLAIAASLMTVVLLISAFNSREETVRDGIVTTSGNDDFPPQDDIDSVECSTSSGGGSALATVSITNRSGGQSVYVLTVAWTDDAGNEVTDEVRSEYLPADDSQTMRLFAPQSDVDAESCRVTRIERSGFAIFGG